MEQRICPVCGHMENEGAECCSECGAKTIEYEGARQNRAGSRRKKQPDRSLQRTRRRIGGVVLRECYLEA